MMIIGKLFKFYSFSVSIHKIIKETLNKQNKSHKFSISNKISPIGSFVVDKYSKIWSYEPFYGVNSDILSPKPSHSASFPSFSNYFVPPESSCIGCNTQSFSLSPSKLCKILTRNSSDLNYVFLIDQVQES